jgi:hypothetical protein
MKILISALALFFGLAMVGVEAEAAKRLGGGKSMGTQRNMTQQAEPKAPVQQQQAQQQPQSLDFGIHYPVLLTWLCCKPHCQ